MFEIVINSSTEISSGLLSKNLFKKSSSRMLASLMKLTIVFLSFFLRLVNTVLTNLLNALKFLIVLLQGMSLSVVDVTLGIG